MVRSFANGQDYARMLQDQRMLPRGIRIHVWKFPLPKYRTLSD
ncbi:hypothetical protein HMPREF9061_00921 [Actinomyces sp. oral taxon 181 str. F0379]|nr:hypothetical protein HMPREF9061_00921 [Actinomyces sp. oral taxon 181 str. F0379]